jgi:MFS family permease
MYRRLFFPVYAPSTLTSLAQEGMLVIVPLYVLALGYSPATAAFVTAARGAGMLSMDLPIGLLAARFGDKPVMLGGLAGLTLAMVGLALSTHPLLLGLFAYASGATFAAWMLGRQSYLADACETSQRGRAIAVLGGIMRIGALTGPVFAGLLAERFGFRTALLTSAALLGIAAVVVALKAPRVVEDEPASIASSGERLRAMLATHGRTFLTAGFASISLQLMRSARAILLPLYGHALGLEVLAISGVATLAALADLVLFLPAGQIMDRYGRKWAALPCMIGLALTLSLLPFANDFVALVLVAMAIGLVNGVGSGVVLTIGADLAPARDRASFLGIWRTVGDVGRVSAPLLVGVLVQVATLGAAAWLIAGLGLVGAGVMARFVPETLGRPARGGTATGTGARRPQG